jgi:hypothetical protein
LHELTDLGVPCLFSQQAESYRRLLQESLESRNNPNENGVESYDDEKTLVMMNVLKTIEQLVSSAKDKKELVAEMEKGILPLLEATIRNQVVGESAAACPHRVRRSKESLLPCCKDALADSF